MSPIANTVAVAGQTDFDVPFPFLHRDHVEVRANGIRWYPTEWVNSTRLRLSAPPGAGSFVEIRRNTPIDAQLVKFTDGAVLTQEDLNMAVQQILYKQQEIAALYEQTLLAARVRIGEAGGVAVTPEDAANQIAALVTENQILADFQARIADLNASSETVLSQILWNQAKHETNEATIRQNAKAAADEFGAIAELWTLLGAKSADGDAFLLNLDTVKVSEGSSLAQRLSGLDASVEENAAAIVSEATARADAIGAVAEDLTVVSSSVGDLTSSVSELSLSVNGLSARWGIQLDTNGYVSGIVMNNDGDSSDFTVLVDKFRVINPSNGDLLQPFVVEDGVVKITTLFAGVINADQITAGRLNVSTLIWDGDILTEKLAPNAATQVSWATLPSDVVLVSGDNTLLTLNVPNVATGELLRTAAMISIASADDLHCVIKIYHTPPGSGRYLLYSHDIKLDSDGGAATRIPLQVVTRVAAASSGTHMFEAVVTHGGFGSASQTIRAGTDLEVTRLKR